jgi:hypothetical protein
MRAAPWEHDRGEKPQGSGAQSVPRYVRTVGVDKKGDAEGCLQNGMLRVVHRHVVKLPHTDLGTRLAAHRLDGRARPKSFAPSRRQTGDRSTGLTG